MIVYILVLKHQDRVTHVQDIKLVSLNDEDVTNYMENNPVFEDYYYEVIRWKNNIKLKD
jgi:TRAP-type uncharacterized transport system substrate-binding protein